MKKKLVSILCVICLVTSLAACGKNDEPSESQPSAVEDNDREQTEEDTEQSEVTPDITAN